MTRAIFVLLASLAVLSPAALSQEPPKNAPADAGGAELTAAKQAYEAEVAKATEALLAEFAAEEKRTKESARLKIDEKIKRSELLQEEKAAFEAEGKLPKTLGLKVATSDYQTKLTAARLRCGKAFDAAAEVAGKSDLALAKSLLAEKGEFLAATRTPAAKPGDPAKAAAKAAPSPLVGTWERSVNSTTVVIQKHVTPTHYMVFQYDPNGRVYMAHGGHYTLKGDSLTESVEYGFGPHYDKHAGTSQTTKSTVVGKKWFMAWTEGDRPIQATWEPVEPKRPAAGK